MFITTYGLSVSSTPILEMGEPIGPIEKGITYMVRPFIHPLYKSVMVFFSSTGSIQLLVGPASSCFFDSIAVRCSTLATSDGWLRNIFSQSFLWVQSNRGAGRNRFLEEAVIFFLRTITPVNLVSWHNSAISLTHSCSFLFEVIKILLPVNSSVLFSMRKK